MSVNAVRCVGAEIELLLCEGSVAVRAVPVTED
jgi:hypothetical protein